MLHSAGRYWTPNGVALWARHREPPVRRPLARSADLRRRRRRIGCCKSRRDGRAGARTAIRVDPIDVLRAERRDWVSLAVGRRPERWLRRPGISLLFRAERDNRVNARGASRGREGGCDRNQQQRDGGQGIGGWVCRCDPEEERRKRARHHICERKPDGEPALLDNRVAPLSDLPLRSRSSKHSFGEPFGVTAVRPWTRPFIGWIAPTTSTTASANRSPRSISAATRVAVLTKKLALPLR